MKRQITLKQANSLSEFGRENLARYFKSILIDIPDMIEYLGDEWVNYLLTETTLKGSKSRLFPSNENLCDALWEEVKELLED